jgi:hypothetical protein
MTSNSPIYLSGDESDPDPTLSYNPFASPKNAISRALSVPVSSSSSSSAKACNLVLASADSSGPATNAQGPKRQALEEPFPDYDSDDFELMTKPKAKPEAEAIRARKLKDALNARNLIEYDEEGFEIKKPVKRKPDPAHKIEKRADKDFAGDSSTSRDEDEEPPKVPKEVLVEPAKKKKKKKRGELRTVDEILADFKYSIPLDDSTPLPSIREFVAPYCGCRFAGFPIRQKAKPTISQQAVEVKFGTRSVLKFGPGVASIYGGKLRSYKCQGWTLAGFNANGSPRFGRKPGFSDGSGCFPMVIDEVKKENEVGHVLEVGLSAEAEAYFRTPDARKGAMF